MIKGKYIVFCFASGNVRRVRMAEEIIENLINSGFHCVQIGSEGEAIKGAIDHRQDNYEAVIKLIKESEMYLGIDTLWGHLSSALNKPQVILFGSSIPEYTGTFTGKNSATKPKRIFLEPPEGICEIRPCCKNDFCQSGAKCIDKIKTEDVFKACCEVLNIEAEFKMKVPSISSFTTCFNCIKAGIPFEQSIKSVLPLVNEVVVVDGESTDGTWEKLQELAKECDKIQLYQREYDIDIPSMDGSQKTYGSVLCSGDILFSLDADELVHPDDVEKFKKLSRDLYFSSQMALWLPVAEIWGTPEYLTSRRWPTKWRMFKANPDLIFSIPAHDRVTNETTGEVYSKGMSDGCFPVGINDYQMIPSSNFYTDEMDQLRKASPEAYKELIDKMFDTLGAIEHTSWQNLMNKPYQQKNFWHLQWASLYGKTPDKEPNRFFPDKPWSYNFSEEECIEVAKKLFEQGGEDSDEIKYKIKIKRKPSPLLMEWWEQEKEKCNYLK